MLEFEEEKNLESVLWRSKGVSAGIRQAGKQTQRGENDKLGLD